MARAKVLKANSRQGKAAARSKRASPSLRKALAQRRFAFPAFAVNQKLP